MWKNINNNLPMFIIQSWKTQVLFSKCYARTRNKESNPSFFFNNDTFLSYAWAFIICPDKQKILICALSAACHVIINTKGIWFSNSVSLHLAYCNSWSALRCVAFLNWFQHVLWYWDTNKILKIYSCILKFINTVSSADVCQE